MSRADTRSGGTPLKKLLKVRSFGVIGVIVIGAFYVALPLYAGYDLKSSLDQGDAARLSERVDFASVRVSLRPAVTKTVEDVVSAQLKKAGTSAVILSEQLKDTLMPRIVDGVLASLVTPEMFIRIHASGKSLKDALEGIVIERAAGAEGVGSLLVVSSDDPDGTKPSRLEEIAGSFGVDVRKALGGLGGARAVQESGFADDTEPLSQASGPPPKYGFDNIKHVSLVGPFGLSVGVARTPSARKPELTAEMSFVGGSWKLTGLVPGI